MPKVLNNGKLRIKQNNVRFHLENLKKDNKMHFCIRYTTGLKFRK